MKGVTTLTANGKIEYPRKVSEFIKEYGDQAIKRCVDSWDQTSPQHQIKDLTNMAHGKRWWFCGGDTTFLSQNGICIEISKVAFEVNKHLTAKALRKHPESPVIVLAYWTWWNCGKKQVRGWCGHIEVNVETGRVIDLPGMSPATPHISLWPVP